MSKVKDIKFSVSMCVYKKDNPEYFKEAMDSIINQSKQPDEIILVVDGPVTNNLDRVIKLYQDKDNFRVIRLANNVGHGEARRIGLENCTHELVALMDADDISVYDRFENQLKCFKQDKELSIVGGNINEFIDNTNNIVGVRKVPNDDKSIKEYLKKRCPFNQVTVMFKKKDVDKVGGYIDWYCNEDYYLWIRMSKQNLNFKNIDDNLVFVRVGEEMYQRRGGLKYFKSEAKLQRYMLKNNIINVFEYITNVFIRFVIQVIMPNKVRGFIFKKFARQKA